MVRDLDFIRSYEKSYHDLLYCTKQLGEKGSWLYSPIDFIIDNISYLPNKGVSVLDVGCGVGRHTIPIAQKLGNDSFVVGIDVLDSAKLHFYNNVFDVGCHSNTFFIQTGVEDYVIDPQSFDYIFAVSCLEHLFDVAEFSRVLDNISLGTKSGGINAFVFSVDNNWFDVGNQNDIDPIIEINFTLHECLALLNRYYSSRDNFYYELKPRQSSQFYEGRNIIQRANSLRVSYRKVF